MTFADLEIRVRVLQDGQYPVEMRLNGQEYFAGYLASEISQWQLSGNSAQGGQQLFDLLLGDPELRSYWKQVRAKNDACRIRLWLDAPELHTLPWEMLWEDSLLLAANANTPFSRYLPLSQAWGKAITEHPIRVLVAISNPANLAGYNLISLDVALEQTILDKALKKTANEKVKVEFLEPPVTLARLEAAMRDGYHIFHYLGHGTFSQKQQQAALYFQDAQGNVDIVTDKDLSVMLARQGIRPRLVFLATCQSASRVTGEVFSGLAPKLVQSGVPAVVAMQDKVELEAMRTFSSTFYKSLTEHGVVDLAMNEARSALLSDRKRDVAVPVLFMRLKEGQIFGNIEAVKERDSLFTLPFSHNPTFVGRESDLQILHTLLWADANHVGVCGPGGVGKTQLVSEYARRYREVYGDRVFWIDGTKPLEDEFAQMAVAWSLAEMEDEPFVKLRNLWRYLNTYPDTLIILDNLAELSVLNRPLCANCVPAALGCRLLFTTYHYPAKSEILYTAHRLAVLSETSAMDLLLHHQNRREVFVRWQSGIKDIDTKAAVAICNLLGHLPLALILAAAYLGKSSRRSLNVYLNGLQQEGGLQILDDNSTLNKYDLPTHHDPRVSATLKLQWKALRNKKARYVFRVFGMLRNDLQISYSALVLLSGLSDESELDEAVVALRELSLLEELQGGMMLRIHTLVREFAASKTSRKKQTNFCVELATNVVQAVRLSEEYDVFREAVFCLHRVGWQDLPAHQRLFVLEVWQGQLSPAFFKTLKSLSLEFKESDRDFQTTLSILLDDAMALTIDAACLGMGLWARSLTEAFRGLWDQAIVTSKAAMKTYQTVADYENYANVVSNLVFMLTEQGDPRQADENAQEIETYFHSQVPPSVAEYFYWHWALAKLELKKFSEAENLIPSLIQALDDPDDLAAYEADLTPIYTNLGQYTKAETCLNNAEKAYGDEIGILEKGMILGYRAEVYRRTGRLQEAVNLAKSAVDLYREEEFSSLEIAHAILRWVLVLIDLGQFEKALVQLDGIADDFENILDCARYQLLRSQALWGLGQDVEAEAAWQQGFRECEKLSPEWVAFAESVRARSENVDK